MLKTKEINIEIERITVGWAGEGNVGNSRQASLTMYKECMGHEPRKSNA